MERLAVGLDHEHHDRFLTIEFPELRLIELIRHARLLKDKPTLIKRVHVREAGHALKGVARLELLAHAIPL